MRLARTILCATTLLVPMAATGYAQHYDETSVSVKYSETIVLSSFSDLEANRDYILELFSPLMFENLSAEIEMGNHVILTVSSSDSAEDGRESRVDCTVKIVERSGGGASVGVGGRAVGEFKADIHKDREIEVSGPCDKVEKIVDKIRSEPRERHRTGGGGRGGATGGW